MPKGSIQQSFNQVGFTLPLILIGILLIAGIGAGAFFFGTQFSQKPQATTPAPVVSQTSQPTSVPTPTFTPSPSDETVNWKTYQTPIFSFRYPPDYTVTTSIANYYGVGKNTDPNVPGAGISIDSRLEGNNADFNQAIKITKENLTNIVEENISGGVKISGKLGPGFGEGLSVVKVLLKYKNGAITLEYAGGGVKEQYLPILKGILQTFKFL